MYSDWVFCYWRCCWDGNLLLRGFSDGQGETSGTGVSYLNSPRAYTLCILKMGGGEHNLDCCVFCKPNELRLRYIYIAFPRYNVSMRYQNIHINEYRVSKDCFRKRCPSSIVADVVIIGKCDRTRHKRRKVAVKH